jgi:hypothetical protein
VSASRIARDARGKAGFLDAVLEDTLRRRRATDIPGANEKDAGFSMLAHGGDFLLLQ